MWQGNDRCASKTDQGKVGTDFSANVQLLELLHSENAEISERALEELVVLNMPLVRRMAINCPSGG